MAKKGYTAEQIINKLREAEILLSQGVTIAVISNNIGVSPHTYYRWRKEYGGMRVDQARRLKKLEHENSQLKKLVADLSLDNAILKEGSLTERRAFIRSFVRELKVTGNEVVLNYTIPTLPDNVTIEKEGVLPTVQYSGPFWTRTRDLSLIRTAL
jgi:putative transposase